MTETEREEWISLKYFSTTTEIEDYWAELKREDSE
jgi:hypothetical protein